MGIQKNTRIGRPSNSKSKYSLPSGFIGFYAQNTASSTNTTNLIGKISDSARVFRMKDGVSFPFGCIRVVAATIKYRVAANLSGSGDMRITFSASAADWGHAIALNRTKVLPDTSCVDPEFTSDFYQAPELIYQGADNSPFLTRPLINSSYSGQTCSRLTRVSCYVIVRKDVFHSPHPNAGWEVTQLDF